jgi:hypothetical protein
MEALLVLLHFPRSYLDEPVCSERLLPSEEDDILNQTRAFFSTRWLSAISSSDSQPLTTETAIFVKSHLNRLEKVTVLTSKRHSRA